MNSKSLKLIMTLTSVAAAASVVYATSAVAKDSDFRQLIHGEEPTVILKEEAAPLRQPISIQDDEGENTTLISYCSRGTSFTSSKICG